MALVLDGTTGITSANIADGTIVNADIADVAASKLTGTFPNFRSTGIDDNATSTAITIDASENVGIGVTPVSGWYGNATALQIAATGSIFNTSNWEDFHIANNVYLNSSGTGSYIQADGASQIRLTDAGLMDFKVAASGSADAAISWTTAMAIDNSGRVLVGRTTAYSDGSLGTPLVNITSLVGSRAGLALIADGSGSIHQIGLVNTNGTVGTITTSGSSTAYNTSSDYRLKTDVQPMTGAITTFKQLKPVNFAWLVDGTRTDGFLAHELQEVIPAAATGTKDAMRDEEYEVTPAVEATLDDEGVELTGAVEAVMGTHSVPDMQGIDQSKIVPLLTAALQEAIAKIESLETRLTALEGV